MARLTRVTSKVFAENSTEVGQFGSLNAGTKVTTTDIATIQGLPAWEDGWQAATLGDNCYPTLQERNGLDKVQSYMTNYLYQEGIPEWDAGSTYYIGSIVKLINGTDVQFYKSLIDNNTNSLSDTASWEEILISGANKDLSNLSTIGKSYGAELGMPSGNYVALTLGASGATYTATHNGYFVTYCTKNTTSAAMNSYGYVDGNRMFYNTIPTTTVSSGLGHYCPVKKGQVFEWHYEYTNNSAKASVTIGFIKAEGEV